MFGEYFFPRITHLDPINITESMEEINLFILIMFNCPFCKKIVEVSSRLDVGRHVRMHIRTLDYPVSIPN